MRGQEWIHFSVLLTLLCLFPRLNIIFTSPSILNVTHSSRMSDDQYREYGGSSERDPEAPGIFSSFMRAAFSGTRDRILGGEDNLPDESSSDEDSSAQSPTLRTTVDFVNGTQSKVLLKSGVTDEKNLHDHLSDSSGRISFSGQNASDYRVPDLGNFLPQTDFRGDLTSIVGPALGSDFRFPDRFDHLIEGSSGGENFTGVAGSVRKSIGSIHNVTVRETKRPKDRQRDRDYRRTSFPSSHQLPLTNSNLPSRPIEATPEPESAGEYGGTNRGSIRPPERGFDGDGQVRFGTAKGGLHIPVEESFAIWLIYQGTPLQRYVTKSMRISKLILDAGTLFQLDPSTIVLIFFSMNPVTLDKNKTLAGPPIVPPNSRIMVFQIGAPQIGPPPGRALVDNSQRSSLPPAYANPLPYSKLLGTFKLPKFDGLAKNWKGWDRAFHRFLGLHELDHVLREDFLSHPPLSQADFTANKIVYFLVEDAVTPGTLAAKYVRQAALWNGNAAYNFLHNGFVFSGPQTATVLLAQLSNLRFLRDETGSAFCLRLVEIIEDLEMVPGKAAIFMTDTQKLGYLLSAIRHEKDLQGVYVQLQSDQLRGVVTFEQACQELHHRCEAIRADAMLDYNVTNSHKALLSTSGKKQGKSAQTLVQCLAKDCLSMVVSYLPLCKSCYLQCTAGKTPSVHLRDGMGTANYNVQTLRIDFPSAVPTSRLPEPNKSGKRKSKQKVGVCVIGSKTSQPTQTRLGLVN